MCERARERKTEREKKRGDGENRQWKRFWDWVWSGLMSYDNENKQLFDSGRGSPADIFSLAHERKKGTEGKCFVYFVRSEQVVCSYCAVCVCVSVLKIHVL